jgi:hypothetical protein
VPDCQNWAAWRDHHPRPGPVLRVEADCTFPTAGFTVDLRRPGSRLAAIAGPAVWSRAGAPPVFTVQVAAGQFYSLEVTTDLAQFAQRDPPGWTADKTYATWQDTSLLSDRTVALPDQAWNRLKDTDCLFYRIRTSSERDHWKDVTCSPPPAQARSSPFVAVVDAMGDLDKPDRLVLCRLVFPPTGAPAAGQTLVHVAYSEQTAAAFQKVTILPEGITLDVDEVF